MGQTLSVPAIEKQTEVGQNDRFGYAITAMQGWRISMEDSHAILLNLDETPEKPNSYFAVYDGHGGLTVAAYAGENVHKRLVKEEAYQERRYEEALKKAFLGTDEDLLRDPQYSRDTSGCTAVAALVTQDKIYVANAGDSRSVLSVAGEVKPLSFDHKPTNDEEKKRIVSAGGYVEAGRVNGNLALSRGIGDFSFKKNYSLKPEDQIITSDPDVTVHEITDEDEFLVLACDGIWDCLESQQVVDFIRHEIAEGKQLNEICEHMCDHIIAPDTASGIGCDNMTVLIVALLNGRTMDEWLAWVKDRVERNVGYKTRRSLPQLYSPQRVEQFWQRMRNFEEDKAERQRRREENSGENPVLFLGSDGGLSFRPGSSILSDSGKLMFEEDDSDSVEGGAGTLRTVLLGLGGLNSEHLSLKEQLEAFEMEDEIESSDEDTKSGLEEVPSDPPVTSSTDASGSQQLPNGDVSKPSPPVEQLSSLPGGDAATPVSRIEGLLDKSEDPLKS